MARTRQPIIIVQGAQYGSEAKGAIAAFIAQHERVDIAVRTGATNAGHTVYWSPAPGATLPPGSPNPAPAIPFKMQQLPTAWVVPGVKLVLGAGALIDPQILAEECRLIRQLTGEDIKQRLWVDYRAGVHLPAHAERSKLSGRHHAIGATGKGCSEALIDRIRGRGTNYCNFGKSDFYHGYKLTDTALMLNSHYDSGDKILLEGTQGTQLDLYTGPYPFTTHKQTLPAQWLLEAGLSPNLLLDIVSVVRTYPIRVAGNSGPMHDEISWPELAREINLKRAFYEMPHIVEEWAIKNFEQAVILASERHMHPENSNGLDQHRWNEMSRNVYREALSETNADAMRTLSKPTLTELGKLFEYTTVTRKLRRVSRLDMAALAYSSLLCRPHRLAITFMNYEFPQYWYETPPEGAYVDLLNEYVRRVERACGTPASILSFGPESKHAIYRR